MLEDHLIDICMSLDLDELSENIEQFHTAVDMGMTYDLTGYLDYQLAVKNTRECLMLAVSH